MKVIKAGMDSKAVLARFEAERQALAMMDHPNIAKVLDAGTTDSGRPCFVMELVKGVPITEYCDERKLTPKQRLELFVPVCQAIQHAHQKGVIHRDIKPSNVLVALYDDRPVPKVIDFGVAKAAGQTLTDKTLMTGFGAVVGTPEYMSPEQASLNNLDIDTRSDVYSLGVLLYELLTGSTPVDRKSLGKAALLEILRIVREVEAPKPSHKLSSLDTLPSVAANRGTEPAKLSKLMKGDLDWVLLKALEKDRTRRYYTAYDLARDIQRYLADEIVEARPPSTGYRLSKFVKRHKGQVIAASLVLLALVAGVVGTSLGLVAARRQTELAYQKELEADAAADEERQAKVREAGQRKKAEVARDRGADILDAMTSDLTGDILTAQTTLTPSQKKFLESVLEYYREYAAERGDDKVGRRRTALAANRVGTILLNLGRYPEAAAAHSTAVEKLTLLAAEEPTVENRRNLGNSLLLAGVSAGGVGQDARAANLFEKAVEHYTAMRADGFLDVTGRAHLALARTKLAEHIGAVRPDEARKMLDELVAEFAARPTDPTAVVNIIMARDSLVRLARRRGDLPTAILEQRRIVAARSSNLDLDLYSLASSRNELAKLLCESGDREGAKLEYPKAIAEYRKAAAAQPGRPIVRFGLAETLTEFATLIDSDRPAEADDFRREAGSLCEQMDHDLPNDSESQISQAGGYCNIGNSLSRCGRAEASLPWYGRAVEILRPIIRSKNPPFYTQEFLRNCYRGRAEAYGRLNRHDEAASDWEQFVDLSAESERPWAHFEHGAALGRAGKLKAAEAAFDRGLALREQAAKAAALNAREPHWLLVRDQYGRGKVYLDSGRNELAAEWSGRAVLALESFSRKWPGAEANDLLRWSHQVRAEALGKLARFAEAVKDWDRVADLCPVADRPWVHALRAQTRVYAGEVAKGVQEADELARLANVNVETRYQTACIYAIASGKFADKKEEYAARAMDLLQKAVTEGWVNASHMKQDTDLNPIRERPEFKKLLADLENTFPPSSKVAPPPKAVK